MTTSPPARGPSLATGLATALLLGVHAALLLLALRDPRNLIDTGYHVSLGRLHGEQGLVPYDPMNFNPGGRPNLNAPLLHMGIGALGRLLGGEGDDYVRSSALLAVAQWTAAMLTVWWFGRRLGGDRAGLLAAALACGSAYVAGSFSVGIPSGWVFVAVPWAVHFFLQRSLGAAAAVTAASVYLHLGGYVTAPLGVAAAAALTRRWRDLVKVGIAVAVLTAPYTIHLLRHHEWYIGDRGHVARSPVTLVSVVGAAGLAWAARHPRRNAFLVAWAAAAVPWLFFHPTRFVLQSALGAAVTGALLVDHLLARVPRAGLRAAITAAVVAVATLRPLGASSLSSERAWLAGFDYPRELDWREVRAAATALQAAGLAERLLEAYSPSWGSALGAYVPLRQVRGHWVEVRPEPDPADFLPVAATVHIVPVPPGDPLLGELAGAGLLQVHGGTPRLAIVTFPEPAAPAAAATMAAAALAREARWLSEHASNNTRPDFAVPDPLAALAQARRVLRAQQVRAGRLLVAWLAYLNALERLDAERARPLGRVSYAFGTVACFLGDEWAAGMMDDARHRRLRENLGRLATAAEALASDPLPSKPFLSGLARLFEQYFWAA